MFFDVEKKLKQTNRLIMCTKAVTFKPLFSLGTYGKPMETQIDAQRARISGSKNGGVCISVGLPGCPDI